MIIKKPSSNFFLSAACAFGANPTPPRRNSLSPTVPSTRQAPTGTSPRTKGLYKKYGMDVESIFIPASSTNVAVLVAGQLKFGNGTGGTIASAAVSGANLVAVACFMNTLPYELIVQDSIKTPQINSKGKSLGISRIGSSVRRGRRGYFSNTLGLEPDKDVAIIQVGGSGERACGIPRRQDRRHSPPLPAFCHLTKGMPQRVLAEHRGLSKALIRSPTSAARQPRAIWQAPVPRSSAWSWP